MEFKQVELESQSFRIAVKEGDVEIGRVFLYLIHNGLHKQPYGLIEDLFVKKEFRRKGIGALLLKKVIEKAKENKCYKILATSRYENSLAHAFYDKFGFKKHGFEFRLNLD
ncbi:GNAT family N-acetyltransferase [Candidatus Woesearchaeota archaeon]|nr:MAG: GNAT family N-acetyltransferase [Candidatus Woesearchaeota archaeon ex4484_78]RLE46319.1 MAG: GNAT family N-acetyltransferase [Candidatus Woesearchaeota archaeon]